MAKKWKAALRSERSDWATEVVQIRSEGNFKINWMWATVDTPMIAIATKQGMSVVLLSPL